MKRIIIKNSMLLLFFVSAVVLLVVAITASKMMMSSAQMLEASTTHEMEALSRAVAFMVSADELDDYMTPEDMQKPGYTALREKLHAFSQNAKVPYAYYMRYNPETGMMHYIVDNIVQNDGDFQQDGLASPPVTLEDGQNQALSGEVATNELGDYLAGWDGMMSSWAPVYYKDGRPSNIIACVDNYDIYIKSAYTNMRWLSALLTASLIIVLASCFISLFLYRRKARQSEIASQAKSNFLSRMSHEMRTPMNAIIGLCGMAIESNNMGKIKEYLGNISVSSQHLRQLIDDILDISKIESGKMQQNRIPVNLLSEVEKINQIIRPQTEAKQQFFDVQLDPEAPEYVLIDPTYLRQVLINLLSNAVKFTPLGGAVALHLNLLNVSGESYNLEWHVKDNGIGISDEAKQKLFTPFEQGDNSTTRKYGGSGLGLAISKQLVNLMGGELKMESAPGAGSEFSFSLWLQKANTEEALKLADANNAVKPFNLEGRHILLVEDTEINQMIFEDMFGNYGAQIDTADNGQEGLDTYLANPDKYDLIFMDIQMPVMDGYEATRKIRASNTPRAKTIPIIAVTANVFKEDVEKAFQSEMNGHVRKPFDITQIEETVARFLDGGTVTADTAAVSQL